MSLTSSSFINQQVTKENQWNGAAAQGVILLLLTLAGEHLKEPVGLGRDAALASGPGDGGLESTAPQPGGLGWTGPTANPHAYEAYSSRAIREHLRKRGIRAVIPVPADQRSHRLRGGSKGGRPPAFDRETYKQRTTMERRINRLKQWRGIATRYEKTATIHLAGLHVLGIFIWSAR